MKFLKILFNNNNHQNEIIPEDYLRASGESLFLTILVGAISSITFIPHVYISNPVIDRLGYSNLCVGFDMAPSTYFAFPFSILTVYFIFQFNIYDRLRAQLSKSEIPKWRINFSILSNNLYILSASTFPLLLLVNPMVSIWVHTLLFFQIIFFRALVVIGNYLECSNPNLKYTTYVIVYSCISLIAPFLTLINYINYDNQIAQGATSVEPLVPATLLQIIDNCWFLLVFLGSFLIQHGDPINVNYKIDN